VLVDDVAAFAVLVPEGPWESVDFWDVWETACALPEEAWRFKFASSSKTSTARSTSRPCRALHRCRLSRPARPG